MAKKRSTKKTADPPSFEKALDLLEGIVAELEEGQTGLAESLKRYEEGVKLLRYCHDVLQRAERKIELVTGVDAEGNPVSIPLDDADRSLEDKAKGHSRRRGVRPPTPSSGENPYTEGTGMESPEGLF